MNPATKADLTPPLIADLLIDLIIYIDNLFADSWKHLGLDSLSIKVRLTKRRGT